MLKKFLLVGLVACSGSNVHSDTDPLLIGAGIAATGAVVSAIIGYCTAEPSEAMIREASELWLKHGSTLHKESNFSLATGTLISNTILSEDRAAIDSVYCKLWRRSFWTSAVNASLANMTSLRVFISNRDALFSYYASYKKIAYRAAILTKAGYDEASIIKQAYIAERCDPGYTPYPLIYIVNTLKKNLSTLQDFNNWLISYSGNIECTDIDLLLELQEQLRTVKEVILLSTEYKDEYYKKKVEELEQEKLRLQREANRLRANLLEAERKKAQAEQQKANALIVIAQIQKNKLWQDRFNNNHIHWVCGNCNQAQSSDIYNNEVCCNNIQRTCSYCNQLNVIEI